MASLTETLKDDFSSGTISASWNTYSIGSGFPSVVNGAVQIVGGAQAGNTPYIASAAWMTFTNSYVSAKVAVSSHFTTPGNVQQARIDVTSAAGTQYARLYIQGGTVYGVHVTPAGTNTVNLGTYNPTTMLYWRLRHTGTTGGNVVYAGLSADSSVWVETAITGAYPADWADTVKFTWTNLNQTSTSGGTLTIDDVNIILRPPSKRPTTGKLFPRSAQGGVIPTGGSTGQLLTKYSGHDYDAVWSDAPITTPNFFQNWRSGSYVTHPVAPGTTTLTTSLPNTAVYGYPLIVPNKCTLSTVTMPVSTVAASAVWEIYIHTDTGNFRPGTRLWSGTGSGTASPSPAVSINASSGLAVTPGLIWILYRCNVAGVSCVAFPPITQAVPSDPRNGAISVWKIGNYSYPTAVPTDVSGAAMATTLYNVPPPIITFLIA